MDPEHLLPCAERSCDVVGVFLVDARGCVLLQERDEHAPVAAEQWGIVGGHVEPGEERVAAMRRELTEETGLALDEPTLRLWYDGEDGPDVKVSPDLRNHWQIWVGRTDVTDDDIVVGEGRRIVFVDPSALDRLDLAASTAYFLPRFLASETYQELVGPA
ncbi:MAG: 8-oxo-dGTP diphosphatase [Nocardioidaceae bacterium]|nr:8-oxo-dGTP diphosphatase [Nocardioidaceae bacterium]